MKKRKILTFMMAAIMAVTAIAPSFAGIQSAKDTAAEAASLPNSKITVYEVVNVDTTLSVRSGPGTSYGSIGYVYPGAILRWTGAASKNGWHQVYYTGYDGAGKTGWVSGSYVKQTTAYLGGVVYVRDCVFTRSDHPSDNLYVTGSIASPLTGWYPFFITGNNNTRFVVFRSKRTAVIDNTTSTASACGFPLTTGRRGDYSFQYFKDSATSSTSWGVMAANDNTAVSSATSTSVGTKAASGKAWKMTVNGTGVYRRYYPTSSALNVSMGSNGQYSNGQTLYATRRAYNSVDGKWWYMVQNNKNDTNRYWIRSDYVKNISTVAF